MPAGVTQITVLDGQGLPKQIDVWSSTGGPGGNLSPLQTITGADAANPASAANPFPTSTVPYKATPKGYQQISSLSSATNLSPPAGSLYAVIACEVTDVRWRDDGTPPTASIGMRMYAGAEPQIFSGDLTVVQFIAQSGNPTLTIAYYG